MQNKVLVLALKLPIVKRPGHIAAQMKKLKNRTLSGEGLSSRYQTRMTGSQTFCFKWSIFIYSIQKCRASVLSNFYLSENEKLGSKLKLTLFEVLVTVAFRMLFLWQDILT